MTLHEIDEVPVRITIKAKSKSLRLMAEGRMLAAVRDALRGEGNRYWQRGDAHEYHIRRGEYSIVVKPDPEVGELVIVTQMHAHPKYHADEEYERVDEVPTPSDIDGSD